MRINGKNIEIRQGTKDAILQIIYDNTAMPARDIFDFIYKGVAVATTKWLEQNKKEIISAISETIVAAKRS